MDREPRLAMDSVLSTHRDNAACGRSRLVRLGQRLGLWPGEIRELLALYDASGEERGELSRFVSLVARYQRYVRWRATVLRSEETPQG
jgi:hypothetical protein